MGHPPLSLSVPGLFLCLRFLNATQHPSVVAAQSKRAPVSSGSRSLVPSNDTNVQPSFACSPCWRDGAGGAGALPWLSSGPYSPEDSSTYLSCFYKAPDKINHPQNCTQIFWRICLKAVEKRLEYTRCLGWGGGFNNGQTEATKLNALCLTFRVVQVLWECLLQRMTPRLLAVLLYVAGRCSARSGSSPRTKLLPRTLPSPPGI